MSSTKGTIAKEFFVCLGVGQQNNSVGSASFISQNDTETIKELKLIRQQLNDIKRLIRIPIAYQFGRR